MIKWKQIIDQLFENSIWTNYESEYCPALTWKAKTRVVWNVILMQEKVFKIIYIKVLRQTLEFALEE